MKRAARPLAYLALGLSLLVAFMVTTYGFDHARPAHPTDSVIASYLVR